MHSQSQVNGVDVKQMVSTINAINEDTPLAGFQFRASNKWVNGSNNCTTVSNFYGAGEEQRHQPPFRYEEDEAPVLLGQDKGANPVEYLLTALAGCLTTTLVLHAAAKGIELDTVESELEGDLDVRGMLGLDESVRNGYRDIRVRFRVSSPTASEAELQQLVELAQQRSPVFDIVTHEVPVHVTLEPPQSLT
ncbi:osmotically inducible protein C [Alkalilimnicola ehrlichii]|uniref:Osmotically inducible protein C n=1 Tax=Alkalilimnicola ehrlichii TaxID=351052 RepID=A0A3E0WT36_9GAMM|nr:OsmC family protein [Alkalilimnicola ehrlichii]RFA29228.1 osmotically inducible protein C [Alkalilimnicola ehrlichii]RFA36140.1 osmotically inducible protein C [Alkalilimnicola ehrlichii]